MRELVARLEQRQPRREIGRTLFDLLVPVELEPFLGGTARW